MGKNKLLKFEQLATFQNVYQNYGKYPHETLRNHLGVELDMRGKWHEHFGNQNNIVLELACGGGEYTVGMAERLPDTNYVGLDIKGNRIWNGARYGLEKNLKNAAFIRTRIESLDSYFAPNEVSEIWITFADPFLSKRRESKRLTHTRFLNLYRKVLKPNGLIHLKTDCPILYAFTLEMIELNKATIHYQNDDIYGKGYEEPLLEIKTKYERMHLLDGRTIKYVKFELSKDIGQIEEEKTIKEEE